jgi:hypothetical protein
MSPVDLDLSLSTFESVTDKSRASLRSLDGHSGESLHSADFGRHLVRLLAAIAFSRWEAIPFRLPIMILYRLRTCWEKPVIITCGACKQVHEYVFLDWRLEARPNPPENLGQ